MFLHKTSLFKDVQGCAPQKTIRQASPSTQEPKTPNSSRAYNLFFTRCAPPSWIFKLVTVILVRKSVLWARTAPSDRPSPHLQPRRLTWRLRSRDHGSGVIFLFKEIHVYIHISFKLRTLGSLC